MNVLSRDDCIYLAGIMDARGYVHINKTFSVAHNHLSIDALVGIYKIDESFLKILTALLGVNIGLRIRKKTADVVSTRIDIKAANLKDLCRQVLPYMRNEIKIQQLELCMKLRDTFPVLTKENNRRNKISDEIMKERVRIYDEFKKITTKRNQALS
jgi:hypothetical protein